MSFKNLAIVIIAGICWLSCLPSVLAQEKVTYIFDHPISLEKNELGLNCFDYFSDKQNFSTLPDTIKVLAVMVDFVEDNDARTSGNGKFDISVTDSIIDSPPHNKEYFQDKMLFLENYWRKVTNGKLIVKGYVLDSIYHLPHQMQYYSPPRKSTNFAEIGNLVHDTWRLVDSLTPNVEFEKYQAFCIFHAGAGRDIDLVSVFGYDPTPFDIPSLFLGLNSLKNIFGNDYRGVPVKSGQFFVTNSLILPETENRRFTTSAGTTLLQLGINGLLVGTFGSYLGLPDLFNTKTGRSGIGRFGLMDGQSMFSWSGLFPPEPSAWEKYFIDKKYNLGMLKIIDVQPGETIASLPAVGLTSDIDTIYRVSISAKEYFLIENRNRDAFRNGSTITIKHNGVTTQKHFPRDTTIYSSINQKAIFGSVIDIDEFDWSIPGGVTKDGTFYDGGILIWHIDENVIDVNYANNSINADPKRRGVDLEEADGSQDIGQSYGFLSPGSGSEDGTSLDFWFNGNTAPVYKNEFGANTHPNTMSYDGAKSHITIKDFTQRLPRMSAKITLGSNIVKPLPGFPKFIGEKAKHQAPQVINGRIFISNGDSVFVFLPDGRSGAINPKGLFVPFGGAYPLAYDGNNKYFGVKNNTLYIFEAFDLDENGIFDSILVNDIINLPSKITTPPLYIETLDSPLVFVGCEDGFVYESSGREIRVSSQRVLSISAAYHIYLDKNIAKSEYFDKFLWLNAVSCDTIMSFRSVIKSLPYFSENWEIASGYYQHAVAEISGNTLIIFDYVRSFLKELKIHDGYITGHVMCDINNDGNLDIIITAGRKIYAFNHYGFMLDNFPITVPDTITNYPIIADVDGDDVFDILVSTKNNLVGAYSAKGKLINGFPLLISTSSFASISISSAKEGKDGLLAATSGDGYLYAWSLPNVGKTPWGNYRGNVQHTGISDLILNGNPISEFFPTSRVYNWPNPVYENKTNIRFYLSEYATVKITIIDMAGVLVEKLTVQGIGGIDNDVEWDVSKVQSGIYFAKVEAEGNNKSGSAVIKIAVVK